MLTLTGTIRATATIGGGINRKTNEAIPLREVLQVEGTDNRGLVQLFTLTVPDKTAYEGKVGQQISVPVRAWATGATVNLSFEGGNAR
jgi:hypothetical protein